MLNDPALHVYVEWGKMVRWVSSVGSFTPNPNPDPNPVFNLAANNLPRDFAKYHATPALTQTMHPALSYAILPNPNPDLHPNSHWRSVLKLTHRV